MSVHKNNSQDRTRAERELRKQLAAESEAEPFFRNEGGEAEARVAQREMESIMVDYLALDIVLSEAL